jgi:hypothetical protein
VGAVWWTCIRYDVCTAVAHSLTRLFYLSCCNTTSLRSISLHTGEYESVQQSKQAERLERVFGVENGPSPLLRSQSVAHTGRTLKQDRRRSLTANHRLHTRVARTPVSPVREPTPTAADGHVTTVHPLWPGAPVSAGQHFTSTPSPGPTSAAPTSISASSLTQGSSEFVAGLPSQSSASFVRTGVLGASPDVAGSPDLSTAVASPLPTPARQAAAHPSHPALLTHTRSSYSAQSSPRNEHSISPRPDSPASPDSVSPRAQEALSPRLGHMREKSSPRLLKDPSADLFHVPTNWATGSPSEDAMLASASRRSKHRPFRIRMSLVRHHGDQHHHHPHRRHGESGCLGDGEHIVVGDLLAAGSSHSVTALDAPRKSHPHTHSHSAEKQATHERQSASSTDLHESEASATTTAAAGTSSSTTTATSSSSTAKMSAVELRSRLSQLDRSLSSMLMRSFDLPQSSTTTSTPTPASSGSTSVMPSAPSSSASSSAALLRVVDAPNAAGSASPQTSSGESAATRILQGQPHSPAPCKPAHLSPSELVQMSEFLQPRPPSDPSTSPPTELATEPLDDQDQGDQLVHADGRTQLHELVRDGESAQGGEQVPVGERARAENVEEDTEEGVLPVRVAPHLRSGEKLPHAVIPSDEHPSSAGGTTGSAQALLENAGECHHLMPDRPAAFHAPINVHQPATSVPPTALEPPTVLEPPLTSPHVRVVESALHSPAPSRASPHAPSHTPATAARTAPLPLVSEKPSFPALDRAHSAAQVDEVSRGGWSLCCTPVSSLCLSLCGWCCGTIPVTLCLRLSCGETMCVLRRWCGSTLRCVVFTVCLLPASPFGCRTEVGRLLESVVVCLPSVSMLARSLCVLLRALPDVLTLLTVVLRAFASLSLFCVLLCTAVVRQLQRRRVPRSSAQLSGTQRCISAQSHRRPALSDYQATSAWLCFVQCLARKHCDLAVVQLPLSHHPRDLTVQ